MIITQIQIAVICADAGIRAETVLCAGLTGEGVPQLWERVERFYEELGPRGTIARRRQEQSLSWMDSLIQDELRQRFYDDPRVLSLLPALRRKLMSGEITAVRASASCSTFTRSHNLPKSHDPEN